MSARTSLRQIHREFSRRPNSNLAPKRDPYSLLMARHEIVMGYSCMGDGTAEQPEYAKEEHVPNLLNRGDATKVVSSSKVNVRFKTAAAVMNYWIASWWDLINSHQNLILTLYRVAHPQNQKFRS
jgi:hypothetical protein